MRQVNKSLAKKPLPCLFRSLPALPKFLVLHFQFCTIKFYGLSVEHPHPLSPTPPLFPLSQHTKNLEKLSRETHFTGDGARYVLSLFVFNVFFAVYIELSFVFRSGIEGTKGGFGGYMYVHRGIERKS